MTRIRNTPDVWWSPALGTEWLTAPEWALDEEFPGPTATIPAHRNGMPGPAAYTYRGSDFTLPAEPADSPAQPVRRTARRGRPWHDPQWFTAAPPLSAPAEWIREYEMQARGDL